MNWQDTVLPKERICAILLCAEGEGWEKALEVAEEQAMVSFKEGFLAERKAIQDFYQMRNGDILIPKEEWHIENPYWPS